MKKFKLFSSALAMLIGFLTMAQEKTITGVVSDPLKKPLSSANISIKGTTNGTTTDYSGKYTIQAHAGDVLQFNSIGFDSKSVVVGSENVIDITLLPTPQNLDEVLVKSSNHNSNAITNKGIQREKRKASSGQDSNVLEEVVITGAMGIKRTRDAVVSSQKQISHKELTQASNPSILGSLNGKVSGLQVNAISNGVTGETRVILRGNRSISGDNQALIVIDNVISSATTLNELSPEVIDNVNVIKGAQGAALYGSQGVNGVIVVTTKKGYNTKSVEVIEEEEEEIEEPNDTIITTPVKTPETGSNEEEYDNFIENAFESPSTAPFSTFSIDVDNASYTNIRRFINNGQRVPKDAVRVEEMINFFKYNYTPPQNENPFAIQTEYSNCPWNSNHKLVRVALQGKIIPSENLPYSNLVFLIDVSGSMSDANKLPLVKESLKVLVNQMRKEDKIAIVVYAGAAGLVLPPTSGNEKQRIIDSLNQLQSGGSTAGGAGIQLAYKIAQENFIANGNNRVILATDGDFNVGASSDGDMQTLIEEKRKSGVFLTCLGFGMGNYKDRKMETLADKGNGNYAYIDTIQEANRFLGKEFKGSMFAIAKDVKIQIEFNPKEVKSYRLIGYENRKLNAEDFQNDTIDAGELGSGHTVTAFYEIIPTNVQSPFYTEAAESKYQKKVATTAFQNELATIKFRYKKPNADKSTELVQTIANTTVTLENASPDYKFATAVAWFGLQLRDSKLITNKATNDIEKLAQQGLNYDDQGYKAEFIRLVASTK